MDEADMAEAARNGLIGDGIARARRRLAQGGNSRSCVDCGEPIPERRIAAMARNGMACERCVACQTFWETGC